MYIATWNVNSIRARTERAVAWLRRQRPDVVCLQEIKCTDAQFPVEVFRREGYHVATHGQQRYNGVALLSRLPIQDVARGFDGAGREDEQARLIAGTIGGVRVINV
ncbi:MAG: endonuclease/exonuclease/phosphatase family protein, partial [Myxococcales bacterium]|nr:endonuclease/exonuclease/phosphatase family protein [Myxococcales bacterium]